MAKSASKSKRPAPSRPAPEPSPSNIHLDIDSDNGSRSGGEKNRQATAIRETEVLEAVAGLSLDSVSSNLAAAQVEVQKSLTELSAKLVDRLTMLKNVESAIQLKQDELRQLYEIEAKEIDLDDLKAEIDRQRETWDEEQARKRREHEEQRSERAKQWTREEEEYEYERLQQRRKKEDEFKQKMEDQEKANRNKQELLEKNWAERESELKKRETELADLRAKVEGFPEVLKKAENAANAIATNSVKKEYETKMTLAAKDMETFQKLAEGEKIALKNALDKVTTEIASLKTQLDQARADVKEISSKALESASGRDTLAQMSKLMEKDQSAKPGK